MVIAAFTTAPLLAAALIHVAHLDTEDSDKHKYDKHSDRDHEVLKCLCGVIPLQ